MAGEVISAVAACAATDAGTFTWAAGGATGAFDAVVAACVGTLALSAEVMTAGGVLTGALAGGVETDALMSS